MRFLFLFAALLFCASASAQNTLFPANPGDMVVRGTHAWAGVPGGTAGCVLTSNGPAAAPTWQCALALNFQLPPMATNKIWGNVSGVQAPASQIDVSQFLNTIDYDVQRPPLPGATLYKGADNKWHTASPVTAGWIWTSAGNGQIPRWAPPGQAPGVFTPETYGAICDNNTDNTIAFQLLAAAVNAAGAGQLEFARDCVYRVVPNPTIGAGITFMSFTGLNSLTVNFNGSRLGTTFDFSTHASTAVYMFVISNSQNVTFNAPWFDQINNHARGSDRGVAGIYITEGVTNVRINNMRMDGGYIGFGCERGPNLARSTNVTLNNAVFSEVFYPLTFQKNCDNFTASGVRTFHAGRSYFPYNVVNHKVQLFSDANDGFNDIVIANVFDVTDSGIQAKETNNIDVQYTNVNRTVAGTGVSSYATIIFETTAGSTEGFQKISDIRLHMNINRGDLFGGALLQIANATSTPQARVLSGVHISGDVSLNVAGPPFMQLMTDKDWTGDFVKNIYIENVTCGYAGTAPLQVDGRAIVGPFVLNSIIGNGVCTFTPTNMGGATPAFPFLSYNQVWLPTAITP